MKIVDSKGRLFGKINIFDLGAALVILLVIIGILVVPGTSGSSVVSSIAQTAQAKPIEIDVLVRGLSVAQPDNLFQGFEQNKSTNIIIRNQPYGEVGILKHKRLPRTVVASQPDGSVKAFPDPRPEAQYSVDMLLTLGGKGQVKGGDAVLGNYKVKIGTPIELDGINYNFKGSVVEVRVN